LSYSDRVAIEWDKNRKARHSLPPISSPLLRSSPSNPLPASYTGEKEGVVVGVGVGGGGVDLPHNFLEIQMNKKR